MAQRGSDRGWVVDAGGGRSARGERLALARERLSALRPRPWVQQWRRRHAHGEVIAVRFADDLVLGFEHRDDAERFWADLRERLARFGLELHPDKTRLIEFGRFAAERRRARGAGKPGTFEFLGFTHICGKRRTTGMKK